MNKLMWKIAQAAYEQEMDDLSKITGMNHSSKPFKFKPVTNSGTNVGRTDEYNPTETESEYGQAV